MAKDPQMEQWVAEIRLRARRRLGELSAALPKVTGRNLPNVDLAEQPGKREVLAAAGITKDEAHRCEKLARISDTLFNEYVEGKRAANEPVNPDELVRSVAPQPERGESAARFQAPGLLQVADLEELKARGVKFGTIYADPPWRYDNQASRGATSNHYPGMSVDEISALPVADLAAESAHLHLWTTNGFLFEARRILEAWGFEYRSCFVWVKPQMGMGNYWRLSHEFMLLGVRGSCPFADHSLRSWSELPRGRHSEKPAAVRALVERASPGPRLELFGREPAPGWTVWGNEVGRDAFESSIEQLAA
ncbi:MT-A70 family methyltransferase [Methylibium sp.]|uniref:MT-A70 family methyltransferase n=1 Tax=Methylibium sp. TaxID=2067992 RepID=UPI0025EE3325|nr:MT-A70 family methyltransferase [Methylibium sp.]